MDDVMVLHDEQFEHDQRLTRNCFWYVDFRIVQNHGE